MGQTIMKYVTLAWRGDLGYTGKSAKVITIENAIPIALKWVALILTRVPNAVFVLSQNRLAVLPAAFNLAIRRESSLPTVDKLPNCCANVADSNRAANSLGNALS
jgi:hypothetical protein